MDDAGDIKRRRLDSTLVEECSSTSVLMTRLVARYLTTIGIEEELQETYSITPRFNEGRNIDSLVLSGGQDAVESAKQSVTQKMASLCIKSFAMSNEHMQHINSIKVSDAVTKLRKVGLYAGWNVNFETKKIQICSNTEENVSEVYRTLCERPSETVVSSCDPMSKVASQSGNNVSYTTETLRYLFAKGVHKKLENLHNTKIIFQVENGCLSIEGEANNIEKSRAEVQRIVNSLAYGSVKLSSCEHKQLNSLSLGAIIAEFVKLSIIAGWDVSGDYLYICSQRPEDVKKAIQRLMELLAVIITPGPSLPGSANQCLTKPPIFFRKLELGFAQLSYLSSIEKDKFCNPKFNVSVDIDMSAGYVKMTGDHKSVLEVTKNLQNIVQCHATYSFNKTETFFKCLSKLQNSCISKALKSDQVEAGWEIKDGDLSVCSDDRINLVYAKSIICGLVFESTYPVEDEPLSPQQMAAVAHDSQWQSLVLALKLKNPSLEIQLNKTSSKIKFAVCSSPEKQTVLHELEQIFEPFVIKSKEILLPSSKVGLLCGKNKYFVEQRCRLKPEDGSSLTIKFQDKSLQLLSYSQKSLDYASTQLKELFKQIATRKIERDKRALIVWLSSLDGINAVSAIESIYRTMAKISSKSSSKPRNSRATDSPAKVFNINKMDLVAGDITDIVKTVEGILTNHGTVSAAVLKATNNGTLSNGFQKLRLATDQTLCAYHIDVPQWNPVSSLLELKSQLGTALSEFSTQGLKSILLPAIGTGNLGYPPTDVADMMLTTTLEYLDFNPQTSINKVIFVSYKQDHIYQAFSTKMEQMKVLAEPTPSSTATATFIKKVKIKFSGLTQAAADNSVNDLEAKMKDQLVIERWITSAHGLAISKLSRVQAIKLEESAKRRNIDINITSDHTIIIEGLEKDVQIIKVEINTVLGAITESAGSLPPNWEKGAQQQQQQQQVILDPVKDRDEYNKVHQLFSQTAGTARFKINQILRVQNADLHTQYEAQKRRVSKDLAGNSKTPVERFLWHGTDAESVRLICQHEFNRSFAGKNGVAYGQGVYFAATSQYSLNYSRGQGDKHMILAKVATGKYIVGNPQTARNNLPEGYHSTVDNESSPTIFVVYHDAAAYPQHVIKFSS